MSMKENPRQLDLPKKLAVWDPYFQGLSCGSHMLLVHIEMDDGAKHPVKYSITLFHWATLQKKLGCIFLFVTDLFFL